MTQRKQELPIFAFSITGTRGDADRIFRLLLAVYHPRNEYVIHLDAAAPPSERQVLWAKIQEAANGVVPRVGNVYLIPRGKSTSVTYRGVTMLASYLHCAAVLLMRRREWDWFINLSASDYPLITPDDLIGAFASLPRHTNFVEHSSNLGWKEYQRSRPIAIDPGLYSASSFSIEGDESGESDGEGEDGEGVSGGDSSAEKKQRVMFASQRRTVPTSFRLFEGSAWVVVTREFVEYITFGWENLPRILLLYFANYVSAPEWYFQTVACNSPFRNTTVNSDLHFIKWDFPAPQHPRSLGEDDFEEMVEAESPFARKFPKSGTVLNRIDRELLGREDSHRFVPGGWCVGDDPGEDPCNQIGKIDSLKLGKGSERLRHLLKKLLNPRELKSRQCL